MANQTSREVNFRRGRPDFEESYGVPETEDELIDWEQVERRLAPAMNYWLATVRPDGRLHSVPVWGIWHDGALHFGGGPTTQKAKNVARNPHVALHLESATEVVIVEGVAVEVTDSAEQHRIDDVYEAKYGIRHGPPVWRVEARKIFAWTDFPTDVTRWTIERG
jgi:hypothetical protein